MFSLIRDITSVASLATSKGHSQMENWEMFYPFLIGIWIMEKKPDLESDISMFIL